MPKNKKNWPEWVKNYKSKWPEVREKLKKEKAPAMCNTAVMQVVSAFLMGDRYYLTNKNPSIAWYKVPVRYIIGAVKDPDNEDMIYIEDAMAREVRMCGFNPERLMRYIMGVYQVDEEGNKHYACELAHKEGEDFYYIDAPMAVIYNAVRRLVMRQGNHARIRMAKRSTKHTRRKK